MPFLVPFFFFSSPQEKRWAQDFFLLSFFFFETPLSATGIPQKQFYLFQINRKYYFNRVEQAVDFIPQYILQLGVFNVDFRIIFPIAMVLSVCKDRI